MVSDAFNVWWKRFRTTGDICPVKLGCSGEDIRALFGEPEAVGSGLGSTRIWKYGDLEFHFDSASNGKLELIYSETRDGFVDVSIPRRSNV